MRLAPLTFTLDEGGRSARSQLPKRLRPANTSGVTGVCKVKKTEKWKAQIGINGRVKCLGFFDDIQDAIEIRRSAEKKYYGHFCTAQATINS